ncbi:MAG: hypothetical protein LAT64_10105 [Phycisphaerales bacterium]|nr:hypothetical protein [Planctomycetota bacterium]MCH8509103.1 hypothetical protein [Phycisphaerales bacterium]
MNTTRTEPTPDLHAHDTADWPHPWPDPTHIHDGDPLDDLPPDRLAALIPEILTDWDCPVMSELGLCRQYRITLAQLRAIARLPRFRAALADLRAVREDRRPDIQSRAHATAIDRLTYIATHDPTSASFAKEIRLAVKALLTLVTPPPDKPRPAGSGPAPATTTEHAPGSKRSPERSERAGKAKTAA